MSYKELFNIGIVLERLKEEFPELTISKIRYLESQGLVTPTRSEAGYRKFSEADLKKIVWVLRQQRENFYPLKTLRIKADSFNHDFLLKAHNQESPEDRTEPNVVVSSISLDLNELSTASGMEVGEIQKLVDMGLIEERLVGEKKIFDGECILMIRSVKRLLEFGLEIRHLRMYLVSAQREAGIIEQLFSAKLHDGRPESIEKNRQNLDEIIVLGREIHKRLLKRSLDGLENR